MSLTVSCPHCQSRIRVPEHAVGRDARCPSCQQVFRVGPAEPTSAVSRRRQPPDDSDSLDDPAGEKRLRRDAPPSNALIEFLLFRRMIAPIVIQVLFWLMVVVFSIWAGIQLVVGFAGATSKYGSPWEAVLGIFGAVFTLLVGPFVARIYAELLILAFRIYETLTEIKEQLDRK